MKLWPDVKRFTYKIKASGGDAYFTEQAHIWLLMKRFKFKQNVCEQINGIKHNKKIPTYSRTFDLSYLIYQ